jgi:hypothetical protein
MPTSPIEVLALAMLNPEETELANHLAELLEDDKYNTYAFLIPILPRYWAKKGDITVALSPRSIFKTLSYVHATAGMRDFGDKTRDFLSIVSGFLEGCLFHLHIQAGPYAHPNLPFGRLVKALSEDGAIPNELAANLWTFNKAVNISSKHFDSFPMPERLDEHTFSIGDTAYAFLMMRKLAIPLFGLLQKKGVLNATWPPLDKKLLKWSPLMSAHAQWKKDRSGQFHNPRKMKASQPG